MFFDWCILWSILSVSLSFSLHFRSIPQKHRASLSVTAFIPSKMNIIGLTGGICSGKSTVSQILESYGAYIVDADKLGHAAYLPDSTCYVKLVNNFGPHIVNEDRTINRPALGSIVFSNEKKMKELQSIVWPEIRSMIIDNIAKQREKGILAIVIEAAVMIEAGWQDLVDSLWVIRVCEETAKKRLMKRNNLSEEEALKRIHSQLSNEERSRHANVCIDNDDNLNACELEDLVKSEYCKLT